jgi:hypothetical protein
MLEQQRVLAVVVAVEIQQLEPVLVITEDLVALVAQDKL